MTPQEYWNQDIQRQDQKFYTAFCLLGAACSDYAVGIDLRGQKKLNWSATALYYSLVHCGRLACFIALGDFPIGHEQLGQLFHRGHTTGRTWMETNQRSISTNLIPSRTFQLDDLLMYFQPLAGNSDLSASFSLWGQILTDAKNLRNDSNYEGLLITHEYNHVSVTEAFQNLVCAFSNGSETVLRKAIALMTSFVEASHRRDRLYAFLNWEEEREGLSYLEDSLLNKINDPRAASKVTELLFPLKQTPPDRPLLAEEVRRHVAMGVFEGKKKLMDDFKEKIERFTSHLN